MESKDKYRLQWHVNKRTGYGGESVDHRFEIWMLPLLYNMSQKYMHLVALCKDDILPFFWDVLLFFAAGSRLQLQVC
jgi:hypothetical protein